jgi:acetyl esterase/lipase
MTPVPTSPTSPPPNSPNSPPPFDPELRSAARLLPRQVARPAMRLTRLLDPLVRRRRPPAGVTVESVGEITVRVRRPPESVGGTDAPLPALLWIHGGGFVAGSAWQDDKLCAHLAAELGALVASVDYRLAPEHPYPVPLHDCHDALVWLAARDDVDADRIAIGGASAGGGLAAALALLARERGEVRPAFQLLSYPMLDDRTVLRTDIDERRFRLWNNEANRLGWASYLGVTPGSDGVDPLAAPARCDDLAGLPPAWIGVGTLDLFHDEDLAYAERLAAAGVPCEVTIVEGAFHGFDGIRPKAGVSRRYLADEIGALAAAFAR